MGKPWQCSKEEEWFIVQMILVPKMEVVGSEYGVRKAFLLKLLIPNWIPRRMMRPLRLRTCIYTRMVLFKEALYP
jgi:hypothetical protein